MQQFPLKCNGDAREACSHPFNFSVWELVAGGTLRRTPNISNHLPESAARRSCKCIMHGSARYSIFDSALSRKLDAEWLFHEEKATLHATLHVNM